MFHEFIYELGCTKVPDAPAASLGTVATAAAGQGIVPPRRRRSSTGHRSLSPSNSSTWPPAVSTAATVTAPDTIATNADTAPGIIDSAYAALAHWRMHLPPRPWPSLSCLTCLSHVAVSPLVSTFSFDFSKFKLAHGSRS